MNWKIRLPRTSRFASAGILHPSALEIALGLRPRAISRASGCKIPASANLSILGGRILQYIPPLGSVLLQCSMIYNKALSLSTVTNIYKKGLVRTLVPARERGRANGIQMSWSSNAMEDSGPWWQGIVQSPNSRGSATKHITHVLTIFWQALQTDIPASSLEILTTLVPMIEKYITIFQGQLNLTLHVLVFIRFSRKCCWTRMTTNALEVATNL